MPRLTREATVNICESTLRKTALRVLNGQRLVSPEVEYIIKALGAKATQQDLDAMVMKVRAMPWNSIMPRE